MTPSVSRQQVVNRLREAGFRYNRKGDRVEIYRQHGTAQRVDVPLRDHLPIPLVRIILKQASLTSLQIERFLGECEKTHQH